jgi:hypothetical protein
MIGKTISQPNPELQRRVSPASLIARILTISVLVRMRGAGRENYLAALVAFNECD